MRKDTGFGLLKKRFLTLEPGEVAEVGSVAAMLAKLMARVCGRELAAHACRQTWSSRGGRWDPPVLSFALEHHGAMNARSTRAELLLAR